MNRIGEKTVTFDKQPRIITSYTIVGPLEGLGPHALTFQEIMPDISLGQDTPEKTERLILEMAIEKTLQSHNLKAEDIQFLIAGDLLNQIGTSAFSARGYSIPFLGIYGACSTFCQALGLSCMLIQGEFAQKVLIGTASHYQTAERQFRYPIELNIQHVATNQHTVTGGASAVISVDGEGPRIIDATFGSITDYGLKDANDLGSAMAPAAFSTLKQHLTDTGRGLDYYDVILTGDLGIQGTKMLKLLLEQENYSGLERLEDAGAQIYGTNQQVGAGGSGSACVAVMTLGYLLNKLNSGKVKKALVIATGAMLSSLSVLQGDSIPCVAHAISIEG